MAQVAGAIQHLEKSIRLSHPDLPEYALILLSKSHIGDYRGNYQSSHAASGAPHRIRIRMSLLDEPVSSPGTENLVSTLIHEMVHLLAHHRGLQDTRGDWHTDQFRALARELGLVVEKHGPRYGWARTRLSARARRRYHHSLSLLHSALAALPAHAFAVDDRILWKGKWMDVEPGRPPVLDQVQPGQAWWLSDTFFWTVTAVGLSLGIGSLILGP